MKNPGSWPPEIWEALCRRCGKCCAEKVEIDGTVYLTKKMCRFLDTKTRQCSVYANRYKAEPECVSTQEGLPLLVFPADCPYTKFVPDYHPPVETWDDAEVDAVIRELLGDG